MLAQRAFSETLKLLSFHPGFLADIRTIRVESDLPSEGLSGGWEDKKRGYEDWLNKMERKDTKYKNQKTFKTKVSQILKARADRLIDSIETDKQMNELLRCLPSSLHHLAINRLLSKFKLFAKYRSAIENFLFYNDFCLSSPSGSPWTVSFAEDEHRESHPVVIIKMYSPLTLLEQRGAMRRAHRMFRLKYTDYTIQRNPYRSIDRDIKILELTKQKVNSPDGMKTDVDVAAAIFEDAEDTTLTADIKRQQIIWSARKRFREALLDRFPPDTFPSS